MKKKLINIILIAVIVLSSMLIISCSKEDKINKTDNKNATVTNSVIEPSNKIVEEPVIKPVAKEVKMDKSLKTKLDTFFSNFSEAFVKPFEEGNIDDKELISFAVSHIIINNWGAKNNMVEERKEDYYTFPFASGEAYTFSQIDKLYDIGGSFYTADISIYTASSGFTGDPHSTMDYWKKSDPHDVPALQKKMTAKIKMVSEDGNERYILVSYKYK